MSCRFGNNARFTDEEWQMRQHLTHGLLHTFALEICKPESVNMVSKLKFFIYILSFEKINKALGFPHGYRRREIPLQSDCQTQLDPAGSRMDSQYEPNLQLRE